MWSHCLVRRNKLVSISKNSACLHLLENLQGSFLALLFHSVALAPFFPRAGDGEIKREGNIERDREMKNTERKRDGR